MKIIKALIEGGEASAKSLGPALAAAKLNIGEVISAINEKTKEFSGIEVPIDIIIREKGFDIKVGSPSISQLIKAELGVKKLAKAPFGVPGEKRKRPLEGEEEEKKEEEKEEKEEEEKPKEEEKELNLKFEQVLKITKVKFPEARDIKTALKQVVGTCVSCGVKIDEKNPKEILNDINSGKLDAKLNI